MKKKVLSVLIVFMMCLGLAGCGGGSNSASDDISGKVSLNGSTSMEKFVNALSEGIKEEYPCTIRSTIYRIWCRSRSSCFKNNRYRRFFSCFNR